MGTPMIIWNFYLPVLTPPFTILCKKAYQNLSEYTKELNVKNNSLMLLEYID